MACSRLYGALIADFERIQAIRQDYERRSRDAELADAQATAEALRATTLPQLSRDAGRPAALEVLATRREIFGYFGAGLTAVGLEQVIAGLEQVIAGWQSGLPRVVHALEVTQRTGVSDPAALEDLNTVVEHYKRILRSTPPSELYDEILGVRVHADTLLGGTRTANNRSDLYDGQAREAVTHAQRGQQLAPLGTVAHAQLVAQEMRAWALIGNSDKVASTRRRAEKAIVKLPSDTPTRGAFSISLADDPPYTATSLLLLGRHKEAEEATRHWRRTP